MLFFIYCKDCKYNYSTDGAYVDCDILPEMFGKTADNYCSYAELKRGTETYAVPVIRCKECKYYTGKWCSLNSRQEFDPEDRLVNGEGFCARAERKEGAEHETD